MHRKKNVRPKPNRATVGKIASDLLVKEQNHATKEAANAIDIQRATEQEYLDNLVWAVKHALKQVDCSAIKGHEICASRPALTGDFYIVCLLKRERLLENVLRNYFIATTVCPTPTNDQTVYRYNSAKEDIEFLWVVPDDETCKIFMANKNKIVPEEQGLLKFIMDYYDGTLLQFAKKLNGETTSPGVLLEGN